MRLILTPLDVSYALKKQSQIANTSLVKFCDKDATQKLLIFRSKDVTFAQRSWGEVSSGRLRAFDISKGSDVIILYFTLLL